MKGIFATSSALVTLLLTISPTVASSAGGFQFLDQSTGNKFCKGCAECIVTCDYPGVQGSGVAIGNSYCSDMNGIVSVEAWGGLLTVDFSATIPGDTPVHWQEGNGTWIGGTAPTKDSSGIADVTDQGTSSQQWGSLGFNGGWCVANVVQYQKSDPSAAGTSQGGQYSYNISLFDNSSPRKWIGGTGKPLFVQDDDTLGIDSVLPSVFEITSGNVDSDPYFMSYYNPFLPTPSDQDWDAYSTDNQCSLANVFPDGGSGNEWGYDSGGRTNNCGFVC